MTKNKRLGISVFVVILVIIMALSVIFTFSISYMFSSDGVSGKLFGKYIYIMDTADMEPEIDKASAVIADEDGIAVLIEGNVILFKNSNRENVMRIREVVHNTDSTIYRVSTDSAPENTLEVSKDNVIAKCTEESHNLGVLISFLSSIPGIIVGMLLPCFVILAVLIIKIISIKNSDKEEDAAADSGFDEDDDDDEEFKGFNGHQVKPISSAPLFDPESDLNPGKDFERKKSSIAQNFSQKPGAANKRPARKPQQNSPKAAVEKFKAAVDEKPNAPVSKKPTLVPENSDPAVNEKLAAIKAALSQQETQKNDAETISSNNSAEKTASFPAVKPQPAEPAVNKPAAAKPAPAKKAPSKTSSINSIEDLIKALEEEKKKL